MGGLAEYTGRLWDDSGRFKGHPERLKEYLRGPGKRLGRLREHLEGPRTFQRVSRAAQRSLRSLQEAPGTTERTPDDPRAPKKTQETPWTAQGMTQGVIEEIQ